MSFDGLDCFILGVTVAFHKLPVETDLVIAFYNATLNIHTTNVATKKLLNRPFQVFSVFFRKMS